MSRRSTQVVHVPVVPHLSDDLELVRTLPRAKAVALVKEVRSREWQRLAESFLENIFDTSGMDIALSLTAITDAIVQSLAKRVWEKAGAPHDAWKRCGVFAVGGYGRGELNPYSDLDVLVIHSGGEVPEWLSFANREFQTILWDCGFEVGAAMRGLDELAMLIREDFVTGTTVLEQRMLVGTKAMARGIDQVVADFRKKRSAEFLRYKNEERRERWDASGASAFKMEPNLKGNPGHLRDLQLLRNVAMVVQGSRNIHQLTEFGGIDFTDVRQLLQTTDYLLKLRHLQHFHHARRKDDWELRDQVRVAGQLGFVRTGQLQGVEIMMKEHYLQVRHVIQIVDQVWDELRRGGITGRRWRASLVRRKLTRWFSASGKRVVVRDEGVWQRQDLGRHLMEMFAAVQEHDLHLGADLQRMIREHAHMIDEEARSDPESGRLFLSILGQTGNLSSVLDEMHECGFLGAYLPEWDNITCLMQFDSYHQYTVDEHTLLTLRKLDAVFNGDERGLDGMHGLLHHELPRCDLLALSLILHDVGKHMGRGHVARGAMMVANVARRMGMSDAEEDLVYFLVEEHVTLSDASRMRDIADPDLLTELSERMGSRKRLDYLYCLTWCDAKAVGVGVLTGWQEAIISELWMNLREYLQEGSLGSGARNELIEALEADGIDPVVAEEFIDQWPPSYVYQVDADAIRLQHRLVDRLDREGVVVHTACGGEGTLLDIAQYARPRLFADIATLLAAFECDIEDARLWQSRGGAVLFRLRVDEPGVMKWDRFRDDLLAIDRGEKKVETIAEQRRNQFLYIDTGLDVADSGRIEVEIKVDQKTNAENTILDVHSKDESGLLGKLARIISFGGGQITYASIRTMGDVALDVFYVQREGRKLSDEEAESLVYALHQALTPSDANT